MVPFITVAVVVFQHASSPSFPHPPFSPSSIVHVRKLFRDKLYAKVDDGLKIAQKLKPEHQEVRKNAQKALASTRGMTVAASIGTIRLERERDQTINYLAKHALCLSSLDPFRSWAHRAVFSPRLGKRVTLHAARATLFTFDLKCMRVGSYLTIFLNIL